MAKAIDVADLIITEAYKSNSPVSNLKLQKVMYFLNVIHLLEYKDPLITDDNFEKWDYGPTISSVYSEYESKGGNEILSPKAHLYLQSGTHEYFTVGTHHFNINDLEPSDVNFINKNLNKFLQYSPYELVDKSHMEPQWQDKSKKYYSDKKTRKYYSKADNRFWEDQISFTLSRDPLARQVEILTPKVSDKRCYQG